MKKLGALTIVFFIAFLIPATAFCANIPNPTQNFFVNDFANVIDDSTEQGMHNAAVRLQEQTGAQVVAVTIESIGDDTTLEQYAYDLFKKWGIGQAKENNGVLILVAVGDRKSRIEVGVGLEGILPDAKTGRIQDEYMLPYFRANDYNDGIAGGYVAVIQQVYREYGIEVELNDIIPDSAYYPITRDSRDNEFNPIWLIVLFIFLILDWFVFRGSITKALLYLFFMGGRGGRWGGGSRGGGGFGGGFSGGGGRSGGGGSSRGW